MACKLRSQGRLLVDGENAGEFMATVQVSSFTVCAWLLAHASLILVDAGLAG